MKKALRVIALAGLLLLSSGADLGRSYTVSQDNLNSAKNLLDQARRVRKLDRAQATVCSQAGRADAWA